MASQSWFLKILSRNVPSHSVRAASICNLSPELGRLVTHGLAGRFHFLFQKTDFGSYFRVQLADLFAEIGRPFLEVLQLPAEIRVQRVQVSLENQKLLGSIFLVSPESVDVGLADASPEKEEKKQKRQGRCIF
jgi:hypothetical protein